jgi:hypothetical protein
VAFFEKPLRFRGLLAQADEDDVASQLDDADLPVPPGKSENSTPPQCASPQLDPGQQNRRGRNAPIIESTPPAGMHGYGRS